MDESKLAKLIVAKKIKRFSDGGLKQIYLESTIFSSGVNFKTGWYDPEHVKNLLATGFVICSIDYEDSELKPELVNQGGQLKFKIGDDNFSRIYNILPTEDTLDSIESSLFELNENIKELLLRK